VYTDLDSIFAANTEDFSSVLDLISSVIDNRGHLDTDECANCDAECDEECSEDDCDDCDEEEECDSAECLIEELEVT